MNTLNTAGLWLCPPIVREMEELQTLTPATPSSQGHHFGWVAVPPKHEWNFLSGDAAESFVKN